MLKENKFSLHWVLRNKEKLKSEQFKNEIREIKKKKNTG